MKIFTFITLFITLFISLFAFNLKAKESLRFIVNHPGSAPYLYFDESQQKYQGVIPDILEELIANGKLDIKYISNSRKRSEEYMYQGTADLIMLSHTWLKEPDKLIATVPLLQHRSFLYKATPFSDEFSLDTANKQSTLCTRIGFIYPNLAPYIKKGRLIRIDSSNQLSMFRMLFKNRCDLAVMNEFNALNLMNSPFFKDKTLFSSKSPISAVPLNIILRPELITTKNLLNEHIKKLKEKNEIQHFIKRHIGKTYN